MRCQLTALFPRERSVVDRTEISACPKQSDRGRGLRTIIAACVIGISLTSLAFAQAPSADLSKVKGGQYALDKSHARILFSTSHFGFSTYYGFFNDFDARLDIDPAVPAQSVLRVTINTSGIVVSDLKLEKNLKSESFFDVTKFPKAVFKSTGIELKGKSSGKLTGKLTLHGVTRPVTLDVTFNGGGINPLTNAYVLGFDAKGVLKRSDFGIKNFIPLVGDQVTLVMSCEFNRLPLPKGGE